MAVEPQSTIPNRTPSAFGAMIRRNPVALKELRGRMRGARAFIVLTVYVSLMSLFAVVLYSIYTVQSSISMVTTGGVDHRGSFVSNVSIMIVLLQDPRYPPWVGESVETLPVSIRHKVAVSVRPKPPEAASALRMRFA